MNAPRADIPNLLDELCSMTPTNATGHVRSYDADVNTTIMALGDEAERRVGTDLKRAIVATNLVAQVADAVGRGVTRARAHRAHAYALNYAGRFKDALAVSHHAAELAVADNAPVEAARARLGSMQALAEMGRLADAVHTGELARTALIESGEPSLAGRVDINLGLVHLRRDDPRQAVATFDRARPLLVDEPQTLGCLENSRGEALVVLNDFDGAEAAYQDALIAFGRADARLMAAIAEGNLAELATRRGQLHKALYHFERARRDLEQDASVSNLARLRAEQAHAMASLGMPQSALDEFEQVLPELDRLGLTTHAAETRAAMGHALLKIGALTEAETALAAAAIAFDELDHGTARARVDMVRAELAARNGRLDEATRMVFGALALLHDRPADMAAARLLLAQLSIERGSTDSADADLRVSLELARQLDLPSLLADVLDAYGRLRLQSSCATEGIEYLNQAVDQIERIRASFQAERFRAAYLGDRLHTYDRLLEALLDREGRDDIAGAFHVGERSRCRSLLDQVGGLAADDDAHANDEDDDATVTLKRKAAHLQADLNAFYSRLADSGPGPHTPLAQSELARRERELNQITSRLASTHGALTLLAPASTCAQVQASLAAEATMVEYFTLDDQIGAFVIRGDEIRVQRNLTTVSEIEDLRHRLRFQMNRGLRPGALEGARGPRLLVDARRELRSLDDRLIRPLNIDGPGPLVVVPHGMLHLVPFGALWNGESYLVERRCVGIVPSASVHVQLHQRGLETPSPSGVSQPVLIGVADEHAPAVLDEVDALSDALGAGTVCLTGEHATLDEVRRETPHASLVHFACHGRFVSASPQLSGLRLHDKWLTVRDLYAMRLRAELVVLSGCETGLSRIQAGDEMVGLLRGFLAAGARSVMVSLWRVDDAVTARMMTGVYHDLSVPHRSGGVASILRSRQLSLMTDNPHPAHWAPFTLVGQL